MPPPLGAVASLAVLPDGFLAQETDLGGRTVPLQAALYDLLRREQALAVTAAARERPELLRILGLAQSAYADLVGLLVGRDDQLLDMARDGEWTLRDLLRHAIAVELRYGAQVEYAAARRDDEPLGIPADRLPCDRLSPPEPNFAASRTQGIEAILELVAVARAATDRRLTPIPASALERPSLWGTIEMTVRMRAHQIAAHLTEVAVQAEKMLGPAAAGSEARRIVRRCCAIRGAHELAGDAAARARLDERYRRLAAVPAVDRSGSEKPAGRRPTLIVVSGAPGSGKTQLAHALAAAMGCPAVCRDEIKEGMVHASGSGFQAAEGDPLTARTYPLFFDVLRTLVSAGVSVVAEAAFQDANWRRGLEPLLPLADVRIVHCSVEAAVARQRILRRASEPSRSAHTDLEWLDELERRGGFQRLSLEVPTLTVDTTNGYVPDLEEIRHFVG